MDVDSVQMVLRVPLHEVKKLQQDIRQVIDFQFVRNLTKRQLAGLIGKVTAMAGAVFSAGLHTWPLVQELIKHRRARWDKPIGTLSAEAISELRWWQIQLVNWNGRMVIS